jgi:hypothetical protein
LKKNSKKGTLVNFSFQKYFPPSGNLITPKQNKKRCFFPKPFGTKNPRFGFSLKIFKKIQKTPPPPKNFVKILIF